MLFEKILAKIKRALGIQSPSGKYLAKELTAEENYQLQRIKEALQEAGDKARESGLV